MLHLVCTLNEHKNPLHLVLHRVSKVRVQESKRKRPKGFQLDDYIAEGHLGFLVGKRISLKARVAQEYTLALADSPLGADQKLQPENAEWSRLSVGVNDSMELRGWLRSLGPLIEVLAPKSLREAMKADAQALSEMYE